MSGKLFTLFSLIITQYAGIFLVLMNRLDVIVKISIAGVFSATLVTSVIDIVMNIVDVLKNS